MRLSSAEMGGRTMPSQYGHWSGGILLRRILPLAAAMLASVALLGAAASSAAAEPVGLFIAGKKSEEKSKQPKFEAEKYTSTLGTKALTGFEFKAQWGNLQCNEFSLSGAISAATSEIKANQIFWPCTLAGLPTTILANGCQFELNVLNVGPPYVGTTDVVCPAGKAIEFTASIGSVTKCTLQILPQTGVEGVSFENTGTGSARAITVNYNLTAMKYAQVAGTGLGKCTAGEFTNGSFVVSDSLSATK
jgi:hypothetical protein